MLAAARNHHQMRQVSRRAAASSPRSSSTCGGGAIATSSKTDQQEGKKSTWSKIKYFAPPAFFFCPGTERAFSLREKWELAEQWESRLKMEALEIDGCSSESFKSMEFRKVKCKGVFDDNKSILVLENTPTPSDPFAYQYSLLTPLINHSTVSSGVLVNRGRVPRDWADYSKIEKLQSHEIVRDFPQKEKLSRPQPVESVGVVRNIVLKLQKHLISSISRPRPRPQPQPIEFVGVIRSNVYSEWDGTNMGTLVRAVGLDPEATLYVEQIEDIGNSAAATLYDDAHMLARFAKMRKEHIEMIIIWYCCSAGTLYLARWLMRKPLM